MATTELVALASTSSHSLRPATGEPEGERAGEGASTSEQAQSLLRSVPQEPDAQDAQQSQQQQQQQQQPRNEPEVDQRRGQEQQPQPQPPQRRWGSLRWQLLWYGDLSQPNWQRLLSLSNLLSYLVLLFLNVLVNSGSLWATLKAADARHPLVATPASWTYSVRDFYLFWYGTAVACQNAVDRKGWKEILIGTIGFAWQLIWYAECIWLVLYVTGTHIGVLLAPIFCLSAAACSISTMLRLSSMLPELHADLQQEGWEGVPGVAYLLWVYPTSIAGGWHLVLLSHSTLAALSQLTSSWSLLVAAGCLLHMLTTGAALLIVTRYKDAVFGITFVFGMVGMMVGRDSEGALRPDQLVASFCAGILQVAVAMLLYYLVGVPQNHQRHPMVRPMVL